MTMENAKISLKDALDDEVLTKMTIELGPNLKELHTMYSGYEHVNAIITHVQRYAAEKLGQPAGTDFDTLDPHTHEIVREMTSGILQRLLPGFISDTHREFIVRCHARGLSTSDAVWELMKDDETMARLIQPDAVGHKGVKNVLVNRFAYLKPGTARWPEKKYGAIWREAREQHKEEVRDIPLTSPSEQAALLAKHAERINDVLEHNEHSAKDWQVLTNSLVRTLDSLRKVSEIEEQKPTNLSKAQLIAVLERLTLALDVPEQLIHSTDTDVLVGVLERLTLALKSPAREITADEVESIPADTNTHNSDPA